MRASLLATLLLLSLCSAPRTAFAQAALTAASPPELSDQEQRSMARKLKHSQFMLAFGSALLLASASNMAIFGRRFSCYDHDEKIRYTTPPFASGIVAGVSVGLLIGGGVMFAGVPREFRRAQTMGAGRKVALVLGTLGAFAAGSALMALPAGLERLSCIN